MIADVLRAIGQMGDGRFRAVLALGVGLSLALLVGFSVLLVWFAQWLVGPVVILPWIGEVTWLDNAAGLVTVPFVLVASVFLMVPVASAFTGLFLDRIAQAVEDKHYPGLPPARAQGWGEMMKESAGFLSLVVVVNALALVVYIFSTVLAPFVFWAVNGFLLGREYAQMVAARRMEAPQARAFRRKHGLQIWATGVLMAVPLSIPVVNLLVPVLGAATFTHLFHRLSRAGRV